MARYDDDLRFAQVGVLPGLSPRVTACRSTWAELIGQLGLLNQSQAARLAISEGLDRLERKRRARARPPAGG